MLSATPYLIRPHALPPFPSATLAAEVIGRQHESANLRRDEGAPDNMGDFAVAESTPDAVDDPPQVHTGRLSSVSCTWSSPNRRGSARTRLTVRLASPCVIAAPQQTTREPPGKQFRRVELPRLERPGARRLSCRGSLPLGSNLVSPGVAALYKPPRASRR
jgi:hypothetical protein